MDLLFIVMLLVGFVSVWLLALWSDRLITRKDR